MTMINMTPERLAEIEELSRVASQYLWAINSRFVITSNPADDLIVPLAELSDPHKAVCEIEGLFQAVPELLAEVHRLKEVNKEFHAELRQVYADGNDYVDTLTGKINVLTAELAKVVKERDMLMEALTPSGATKAHYMSEVTMTIWEYDEAGVDIQREIFVPWTTVKDIMKMIRGRAAQQAESK